MPPKKWIFSGIVSIGAVISAILVFLLHRIAYHLVVNRFPGNSDIPEINLIINSISYAILYPAAGIISFHVFLGNFFPEKRFTLQDPEKNFIKMVFYAVISAAVLAAYMILFDFFIMSGFQKHQTEEKLFKQTSFLILFLASSIIMTPVLEEYFYRELLGKFLIEKTGPEAGIFLQALLFSMAHAFQSIPVIFAVGIAAGVMYFKFGLKGSVLTHALYNSIILSFAFGAPTGLFS